MTMERLVAAFPNRDSVLRYRQLYEIVKIDLFAPRLGALVEEVEAGFRHALVVEDYELNRRAIGRVLSKLGVDRVEEAGSVREALTKLKTGVDLVFTDICLPEGDCTPIVEAARQMKPTPMIVAISGKAKRDLVVRLIARMIDAYLEKPAREEDIRACIESLKKGDTLLKRQLRKQVGLLGLKEAEAMLRKVMYEEAMQRSGGSQRGAARILGVDRRVVQRIYVQKIEDGE